MSDRVVVVTPLAGAFGPTVRLIVGGVAARADFGFEDMDDLQLAIERLLAEAGPEGRVRLTFDLAHGRIRTRIGPLREEGLADALQMDSIPGMLSLHRMLRTVVDSYGVEESIDGEITVRLEKLVRRGR